jgi:hypothetical protein
MGIYLHFFPCSSKEIILSTQENGVRGSVVVKALCYSRKVAGSITDKVNSSIYLILPAALGPGVYSASNRNEYRTHKKNNVSVV